MINLDHNIAFVIISHSKNTDVINGLIVNFKKFDFKINNMFLLMNDRSQNSITDFKYIYVKKSNWKNEMKEGVNKLKKKGYSKMILWLDDFYLTGKVNNNKFQEFIKNHKDLMYVGLRPQPKRIKFKKKPDSDITNIELNFPYYSSLKAAYWDVNHFLNVLSMSNNIWDFEKVKIPNIYHYESNFELINYWHSIEKGAWKYYTPYVFKKEYDFSKGKRKLEKDVLKKFTIDILRYVKIKLFGF